MDAITTGSGQVVHKLIGGRCNVFLITNGEVSALVDTSTAMNYGRLRGALARLGHMRVDWLICTHIHFDHVQNAARIAADYGARIVINSDALSLARAGKNEATGGPGPVKHVTAALARKVLSLALIPPFEPSVRADNNFDLAKIGLRGNIIFTPGHSPHSISLILDNEIAVVGDALYGVFAASAFPPFFLDKRQMLESGKILINTGCRLFLPSHGRAIHRDLLIAAFNKKQKLDSRAGTRR